ncbi:MAG: PIN domain-containing protein [Prosthecobacter sp.]|uniref:PIN domain-containing protein n=1 Tax=Prosthecobacter sp. TaxID=1965333 RepID=UPI00390310F0
MKFLMDVNVLSEPTKTLASDKVKAWLRANRDDCVVDAVVMAEIWRGIVALPEGQKKRALSVWFARLKAEIPCLDWTLETALEWGPIVTAVKSSGFTIEIRDTLIAASAKRHSLTVATRNVDDFKRCGATVINPFV